MPRSRGGPVEKKTPKLAVHACSCADNGGEKRNVLIVRVLLPIAVNFALRSKTQRRIEVSGFFWVWFSVHTFNHRHRTDRRLKSWLRNGWMGGFKEWVDGWMGGFKEWVDGRVCKS